MPSKFIVFIVFIFFLISVFIFFNLNPSYQKSYEAKFLYFNKNYTEALALADEAYSLNHYNKMAFTIITQSENNIKYQNYIDDANNYYDTIDNLVSSKVLSDENRIRIIMMCKIIISDYEHIIKFKTRFTDDDLIADATQMRDKFIIILKNIEK